MHAEIPPHDGVFALTDPGRTAARRRELGTYYDRAVLSADGFVCTSLGRCRGSVSHKPDVGFYEGQLPYLGDHYDTAVDDGALMRVLVVPMEVAGGEDWVHTGMEHFGDVIRWRASQRFSERNNHMRGVTFALRLAFGLGVGDDRAGEYLDTPNGSVHVFEAYAMVNAVLCSALALKANGEPTSSSRQNAVMRRSCSRHLKAAVRILAPTLVISQGSAVGSHLADLFTVRQRRSPTVASCAWAGHTFMWVDLTHPTAWAPRSWSWLSHPYLHEVVEPSITLARSLVLATT